MENNPHFTLDVSLLRNLNIKITHLKNKNEIMIKKFNVEIL